MSATCRTNPLQQLLGKSDQNSRFQGPQAGSASQQFRQDYNGGSSEAAERHFFNHRENQNGFLNLQHPAPMLPPMGSVRKEHFKEDWVQQFSAVSVKDPLEFCRDYQDSYKNYESRQFAPHNQYRGLANGDRHINMYRPTIDGHFGTLARKEDQLVNSIAFDKEFNNLEKELLGGDKSFDNFEVYDNDDNYNDSEAYRLDDEQIEFQKIANDIVDSCASISKSPSPVSSKLSGSKFMGLMRGISEGSITLKKGNESATGFHSPQNGETVGNEYFPVLDRTH
ncbi:hypothetical protein HG535_0E01050 [Zygotorulaspora mrakii]|uniref:PEX18/PEX21 C-terminal domain-containing protein n=1 Tax=Zygotorulaspora mrakii TaxID=42260 RepID=A0A7H9B2Y7_ZYGMR|nr:uncharacterized protein HG535_0E01050 [Zygotorulaspora mrakii]QLG73021.1 hypothetical protein HG535_0E01050 [Zygotorulaspora mrakii]